ncbi:MAG TPA: hypothetical protein VFE63_20570 [Roseiarcus sp.]|nr:hypothetical protein [Roseiarcus sp.]
MASNRISYAQLLETNNLIQTSADETYWLCVTRTVQESKLFPVPAYMMLSYMMSYFRYPSLLRKIESRTSAEEIGDRARTIGVKIQNPSMGWALPGFYLLGREWLINLGLIRPQDAVEDLIYVMDFWKRFQLSWHRNNGHITNKEFGHRGQFLPERRIQVFHADMFDCKQGDKLHEAAQGFMAAVSQYGFLISCESRISLHNSGPYKIADDREMIVRDFMDLSESDFPWLDSVAEGVPYNNLTVTMAVKDCHFYLVDDWGSFESKPEFTADKLVGVGLYTSDALSDGYQPIAMGSREELTACFRSLTDKVKDANNKLWRRVASWSRDQMIDAGAITYFSIVKDLSHVAGVYDVDDWMTVDERAERFRPLFNDEYSRDALVGLCIGAHPSHRLSEYTMMQHSNGPQRLYSLIPYSILQGEDYTPTSGPIYPGKSYLPKKADRYNTTRGVIGLEEYNRLSREVRAPTLDPKFRHLCETWIKYHAGTPLADELYMLEQSKSRLLKGAGSSLKRADIEKLRARHA